MQGGYAIIKHLHHDNQEYNNDFHYFEAVYKPTSWYSNYPCSPVVSREQKMKYMVHNLLSKQILATVPCLWIATVQVQIFGNPLVAILSVEVTNTILVIELWCLVFSLTNSLLSTVCLYHVASNIQQ